MPYRVWAITMLCAAIVSAKALYVAPGGLDANDGASLSAPLKTIPAAVEKASAGDTIFLRAGTHASGTTIALSKSGTSTARICLFAFPGERPVLDFSAQPYGADNRAFLLTGDYWYFKGLEICYGGDNGIKIEGNNNLIEQCVLHHNGDSGIQLGFAHETENPGGAMCAFNQIINCDAYRNFDFDNRGSDADGFACKMHNGKGNTFRGCRSWENSDDGWDLYETDWPVEITNCWTWHNGDRALFDSIYSAKMGKAMSSFSGNGNGFKLGGNGTGGSSEGTHIVKNCVAFDNNYQSKKGFDQNSHKGGVIVHNCLSFCNGYNYMFEEDPNSGCVNEFKNCVSFGAKGAMQFEFSSGSTQQNNSWNLTGISASVEDFASLDTSLAKAPRQPNGDLPNNAFARLSAGSDLIDKGINVGIPFEGIAPDLGAFEYGGTVAAVSAGLCVEFARLCSWNQGARLLRVYPRMFGSSVKNVSIVDLSGKCAMCRASGSFNDAVFDLSGLARGTYGVRISGITTGQRFVIR